MLRLLRRAGFQDVDEAADGATAVRLANERRPDVVLLDVAMPQLDGVRACQRIHREWPDARILVLTGYAEHVTALDAKRAGASGYVEKSASFGEVLAAIDAALDGRTYFGGGEADADHTQGQADAPPAAGVGELTVREREVVELVAAGRSSARIASELGLSVRTVETHRQNVMSKLGLASVADLVKFAIRSGLASLDGGTSK